MINNELCEIIENRPVKGGARLMSFRFMDLSLSAAPGQFVMLRCDGADAILRRPFCVLDADRRSGAVSVAYDVRGKGTRLLAQKSSGDHIDVLGPLGVGFDISEFKTGRKKKAALVCGGIGVFPMIFLAKSLCEIGVKPDAFAGFRNADAAEFAAGLTGYCNSLSIATDDGSVGAKGLSTDIMRPADEYDAVFACGPAAMLRAVKKLCQNANQSDAQLCVEERMACGVGACLTCACAASNGKFLRACADGPVFQAADIEL